MDTFLRAVGFSEAELSVQMDEIKTELLNNPDKRVAFGGDDNGIFVEYYKMYGKNIGVVLRGLMDDMEAVTVNSCEAYAVSDEDSPANKFLVEYLDDQPVIVFEDIGTGNELVFQLQNRIDLYKDEKSFINYGRSVEYSREKGIVKRRVNFAGLSIYGTIILPMHKGKAEEALQEEEESYYKSLVLRYREGDDEAEEILKIYAEQTSSIIRERLQEEDFLSVVESYLLPMEDSDVTYSILGEIIAIATITNRESKERIFKLTLDVTGTNIQLFINKKDICGMPTAGMRFMGICRLQGSVRI